MQLAYIYQAWEWLTVKKQQQQQQNLKYLLIAKVIVPITTGASRLTAWGPGARWRAPGGDRGGRSPPKLLGFSRFGGPARPFSEGIKWTYKNAFSTIFDTA